jgi:hypothetical protein
MSVLEVTLVLSHTVVGRVFGMESLEHDRRPWGLGVSRQSLIVPSWPGLVDLFVIVSISAGLPLVDAGYVPGTNLYVETAEFEGELSLVFRR